MEAVDQRLVLLGDGGLGHRARLENAAVDVVDLRGRQLPAVDHRVRQVALLRVERQVVAQRVGGPRGQPQEVATRRVAADRMDAVVLGRAQLPAATVSRLDDQACAVVREAAVHLRHTLPHRRPIGDAAQLDGPVLRRVAPVHGAVRIDSGDVRDGRARQQDRAHNAVLRMLKHPAVAARLVEEAEVVAARRLLKQVRKGAGLAVEAALGVERRARVDAPAGVVGVPEHADEHAVHKVLDAEVGRRRSVGRRLTVRTLPAGDADGAVRKRVPNDRAERADVRLREIRCALDVADDRERRRRQRMVLDAQRAARVRLQVGAQCLPGRVLGDQGLVDVGRRERHVA